MEQKTAYLIYYIYRVSKKKRSIFCGGGVIEHVILSKKCTCTRVLMWTVFVIELFHSTVRKFLIGKIYYVLFLMPVFVVQLSRLVQLTCSNTFPKISSRAATERERRFTCFKQWRRTAVSIDNTGPQNSNYYTVRKRYFGNREK
jgi:hypothetical protein